VARRHCLKVRLAVAVIKLERDRARLAWRAEVSTITRMSAKKAKRPDPVAAAPAAETTVAAEPAWIDSADPKKRQIAQVVLVVVWIYVAALCLLALDQWFHWGIFGPKVPPVP
jgi:hypothetical protein